MLRSSAARTNNEHQPLSKLTVRSKKSKSKPPNWVLWIILLLGAILLISNLLMSEKELPPGLVPTPEGNFELSPERQAKLEQELEELENAIQYALIARRSGEFPCYSCPNGQKLIYLIAGETWKFGSTRKGGAEGRYPSGDFGSPNLLFVEQYTGTLTDCMKEEKRKIYAYPFLPEARARDIILIRPPGNKNDN